MQLTPEQNERIRQAKERGERRIYMEFTPEQKNKYQEPVAREMAGKEANIDRCRKIKPAAEADIDRALRD